MSILPEAFIDLEGVEEVLNDEITISAPQKTYKFDFEKNEFITDSLGRVETTRNEKEALQQIVDKILHDARYKYLIYDSSYGNEIDELLKQEDLEEIFLMELERIYEEALGYHAAIESIEGFSAEVKDGSCYCQFTVIGANGASVEVVQEVIT